MYTIKMSCEELEKRLSGTAFFDVNALEYAFEKLEQVIKEAK